MAFISIAVVSRACGKRAPQTPPAIPRPHRQEFGFSGAHCKRTNDAAAAESDNLFCSRSCAPLVARSVPAHAETLFGRVAPVVEPGSAGHAADGVLESRS